MEIATIADLQFLVGNWQITANYYDSDTGQWSSEKAQAQTKIILDGQALKEDLQEGEFIGLNIFSTTANSKQAQSFWLDNQHGAAPVNLAYLNQNEVLLYEPSQDFAAPSQERQRFFKITKDSYEWCSELSEDGGQNWQMQMHYQQTRVN